MDAKDVKKKFFDVTPPSSSKGAPALKTKSRQVMVKTEDEPKLEDPLLAPSDGSSESAHGELVLKVPEQVIEPPVEVATEPKEEPTAIELPPSPISEEPKEPVEEKPALAVPPPEHDMPAVNPLPETTPEEPAEEAEAEKEQAEADKDVAAPEPFAATDALPDSSTLAANEAKDGMQDPKLYDTKAYHVPIKETHHGHGSAKAAFAFGIVCAVGAVAGAVYFMAKLGS